MEAYVALPIMLVLLAFKGFFSGSEIALVSADKIKLRHKAKEGNKGAARVLKAFEHPDQLLSTTLVGTNLSTIALTTIGSLMMFHYFGSAGELYAFIIYTPLFLILGEIVPKSVYQQLSNQIVAIIIYPLSWAGVLFSPVVFIFSRLARFAARLVGGRSPDQSMFISREQFSTLVEMAEHSSGLAAFDEGRIRRVIRFAQMSAGEVMVPMASVTCINQTKTMAEAVELALRFGYHRLPVYEGTASNIVGVAFLGNFEMMDPALTEKTLDQVMVPAQYVSAFQTVDDLIPLLANRADQMAVVVDEFGSATGIVTFEDIKAQVVGKIDMGIRFERGHHVHERIFEDLGEGEYLMDARFPLVEVNELLGTDLPTHEFNTLGGLTLARLRHIPKPGESFSESGYRFVVEESTDRAVQSLKVVVG